MNNVDNFRTVWVFHPENEKLRFSDLLVFSFLAYRDRFQDVPKVSKIVWSTGLSRSGVEASIQRLVDLGLIVDGRPHLRRDFFRPKKKVTQGDHWSLGLVSWKYIVPASVLRVSEAMVFSYLRDKTEQGYSPTKGWTTTYLAKCLRLDERTVSNCLVSLDALGLVKLQDSSWLVARKLTLSQLNWFALNGYAKTTGFFDPEECTKTDDELKSSLEKDLTMVCKHVHRELDDLELTKELVGLLSPSIIKNGELVDNWQEQAEEMIFIMKHKDEIAEELAKA